MQAIKHTITHPEHTEAYFKGFETMLEEIKLMGFESARDKFNADNPVNWKPSSLDAYYYAKGGMQALSSML